MKTLFALTGLILTSTFSPILTSIAQVNSWTNPASGNWQDPSWSLGVLPNSSQSHIMITNSGWKAVAIGRATALNHVESLDIRQLTVSSPFNSFNTLMLNFSGREWPLRVATDFHVGLGAVFRTLDSGLRVGNLFLIDGVVYHTDFSEVIAYSMSIGNIENAGPPEYYLTNGILSVPNRFFLGPVGYGAFRQYGGSNHVSDFRFGVGLYQLYAGRVAANTLRMGSYYSIFDQQGGDVSITNDLVLGERNGTFSSDYISGRYALSNGTLQTSGLRVGTAGDASGLGGGEGFFTQLGGSNSTTRLHVGAGGRNNTLRANYSFMGGFLRTSATTVGPGYDVAFVQSGGLHLVDGAVTLSADFASDFPFQGTMYELAGGTLRSHSVTISESFFYHVNGTNDVAGDLLLAPSAQRRQAEYALLAGRLTTSNTIVRSGWGWGFRQGGGVHQVDRLLELSGHGVSGGSEFIVCAFDGGQIIAPDIRVANGTFLHSGSGVISNRSTITFAGARWSESTPNTSFGALRLETGAVANSVISLSATSATVRFLSSAAQPWVPDARLLIDYWWRGSTNGGGDHRVIFGNSSAGLTAQQLSQIRFRDPAGFPSGEYPARILSTGEIVPAAGAQPPVMLTRNGSRMLLQWPDGYTLQAATNVSGPFIDINTASPYEIQTGADRQRYFRLRR